MDRRSFCKSVGLALALPAGGAFAQGGSGRAIRIVVPLPPGSSNDYVTRVVAPYLTTSLGQTVVVDNKAGANGIIGTMDVVRSAPDGNTLLVASSPLAVNVATVKNLPYDPLRDLTPIAGVSLTYNVLVVKPTFPAKTFPEFIAYAKQHPKDVSIGYTTTATQVEIATIGKMAGIELLPVPYKGTPATVTDVLGGSLSATFLDPGLALAQTKGGQMRALAISSIKRSALTPDWPAMSETLAGFDFAFWNGCVGPAGMSRELVNKLNAAMNNALNQKDVVDKYAQAGTTPFIMTPDELKAYMEAEIAKWIKLAKEVNFQPETI